MLDLDPRFLGAVSTPGVLNITKPFDTVCWSKDNQVALITDGGGIFVVNFVHNHEEIEAETLRFIGNESRIPSPKTNDPKDLENYTGISLTKLLQSKDKNEIFEAVRDTIMCPKGLENAEVHHYFTKIGWSERPLKMKPTDDGEFGYILGALDSHFNLNLYLKSSNENENSDGDWRICVELSESYRQMLLAQFWDENFEREGTTSAERFEEYRRRMYDLAIVDFIWLPPWESPGPYKQASEGELVTTLVTAHASGYICIWNICINFAGGDEIEEDSVNFTPNFFVSLEYRRELVPQGEVVSSMKFFKLSSAFGVLVVGSTEGSVLAYRIFYNSLALHAIKQEPGDDASLSQKFRIDDGAILFEKDNIEVQTTCGVIIPCTSQEGHDRIQLYIFKHPNFMIPIELALPVNPDQPITIEQTHSALRISQGIITGCLLIQKKKQVEDDGDEGVVLMTLTERGVLSYMYINSGEVADQGYTDFGYLEEHGVPKEQSGATTSASLGQTTKKRLQFGGLAISPNEAMVCAGKTLAEYYNHLALRTPSVLQFHSVMPSTSTWPFVLEKFRQRNFLFHLLTDVMSAFRMILTTSDAALKEVLDWYVPICKKSIQELQLLYWILRVQPHVNREQLAFTYNIRKEQPKPFLDLKSTQVRLMRRETLVSDRILTLRCYEMVKKVVETPEKYNLQGNVTNLQSLMIMYDYLSTKASLLEQHGPLPMKPRVLVDPPPRKPACSLCGKPIKLLSSPPDRWQAGVDFTIDHEIDLEEIEGILWDELTHVQKSRAHPITCCVLSLVPTAFPYRKCTFCGTICMLHPTFNEEPLCPFCNQMMEPPLEFCGDEELDHLDNEFSSQANPELDQLIHQIQIEEEEQLRAKAKAAPMSRRARIENMYIDS